MMRSLSSAVSGLRAHQTKMDVIGDNIANVNTYGFKSSRVTFSDVYYQTLSSASSPTAATGGTNPTQIGYGASVATIDVLNSAAAMAQTNRALDVYINGDGLIAVQDADGNRMYTRLGVLGFDAAGNLVDANGNFVLGFQMRNGSPVINPDGTVPADALVPINVDTTTLDKLTGISISPNGEIVGVLPGDSDFKLTSGMPAWLKDIDIPANSNLTGPITVKMELDSRSGSAMPAAWISAVKGAANSGLEGTYDFYYDDSTSPATITAINPANGHTLTGTYKRGEDVELKDSTGAVVMTVTTDNYNLPASGAATLGSMTFETQLQITVTATDKGGNKYEVSQDYNGRDTSVTFSNNDIPGGLTIQIDPDAVESAQQAVFDFQEYPNLQSGGSHAFANWLNTVEINSGATLPNGTVSIDAGMKYTGNMSTSAINANNWLHRGAFESLMKLMAENEEDDLKDFEISIAEVGSPATSYTVTVTAKDSANNTVTLSTSVANLTSPIVIGGQTIADGIPNASEGFPATYSSLGQTSSEKTIQVLVDGTVVGETAYNGGEIIKIGDVTLTVDSAALNTYLSQTGGSQPIVGVGNDENVGVLSYEPVEQWALDAKSGNVTPSDGETLIIGVIAVCTFSNLAGMTHIGDSYFGQSANSGEAQAARPGTNASGELKAGYLEMSNVDISQEFTDMITTQRGFQANTRIITVSDEMLQELVNIKR